MRFLLNDFSTARDYGGVNSFTLGGGFEINLVAPKSFCLLNQSGNYVMFHSMITERHTNIILIIKGFNERSRSLIM